MKSLISAVLLIVALASNGAGPVAASGTGPQEQRPVPSVPSTIDTTANAEQPGEEVREEFHQTYPISPTGRVSLENINGGVQIKVWDQASVQVDAIKRAYRRERLAEAKIEVSATEENIRIKTEYPDGNQTFRSGEGRYNNPAIVDYTLTVPRKAVLQSIELINGSIDIDGVEGNVKASSINGKVMAKGLAGEARLSTINGPLHVTFTQLDESKAIDLGSINGNVTLIIPSNANASIRAGTVHGGISSDFGLKVKHGEYVGHSLNGQIGTGGPRIKLSNVNGGIQINHAQDGLPVSPGTSIESEVKNSDGDVDVDVDVDVAPVVRARVDTVRIAREAQRQVNQAMREAQREIERAQRQMVRERARARVSVNRSRVQVYNNDRFTAKESKTFAVSGSPRVTINTFDGHVTI
ncbi:MAG TPA: DUF4097 family beta strand repeat-containing protein, partial [Pyrinomonadaceae bacterium]